VQWTPEWGQARITGMIENRPDWCLSRQRTWGVPITLFTHKTTGKMHPRTVELINEIADQVERHGIEYWFDADAVQLLGADAEQYEKATDVMDVWADSGLSFECVAALRDDFQPPVDLYLEGSDQHRGWFHSSLLMSEALYERAPYKGVLTHGFTVDDKGRKMSKSLGNGIEPQDIMKSLGADMLRLWVAATDYANEMSLSQEILKRIAESYRRMRNTVRFLLGNLEGFTAAKAVPADQLVAFDAWAIARTAELQREVIAAYRDYAFHLIYQKVHNFCVVDLGGLYLDVLKDRLYTTPADSHARRSAQTAMWHIAEAMTRWLAPILSFTAEEVWRYLPGTRNESVFLNTWHPLPAVPHSTIDWPLLLALRGDVTGELERLRVAGEIGAPLEAELDIYCTADAHVRLAALGDELRFLMITSVARLHRVDAAPAGAVAAASIAGGGVWIRATRTAAAKCARCYHRVVDVGQDAAHPELCLRCVGNISGGAETRRYI
jgi:isoleucyl-tRNA synthetase